MKILQICAYSAPYEGNFIQSLKALELLSNEQGYETIYCFPEVNKSISWCNEFSKGRIVYYLPLSKARIKFKTYHILKSIFKSHKDIIIAHSHFELYDIPLTLTAPKRIKIFWHLHDAIESYLHGIYKYVWKFQYSFFSKRVILLSVSELHKETVIKLGFPRNQAYFIPNGIDVNRIKRHNSNNSEQDFIIFGWDYFRKGVDLAEKAIKHTKFSLGIIRQHTTNNTQHNITNISPNEDINKIYNLGRCFLHISRAEGMSYALLEALYSGMPVIVSNIPENQIAQEFPTAYMVENENVESIINIMKKLKNKNFAIDENKIIQTRQIINIKYSTINWAINILKYYND